MLTYLVMCGLCLIFVLFPSETCVKYNPHFDWVVAHIGSCFPLTVISRVLVAGLHEFAYNQGTTNVSTHLYIRK